MGDTDRATLGLDSSTALRSLPRYQELVRAIFEAPDSTQEMPCVEWKREGDAKDEKWRAELAKQVLGLANRDPEVAATWFGGCAYVLVGVAPDVLNGSPVHDAAQIESWLAPYVGRTRMDQPAGMSTQRVGSGQPQGCYSFRGSPPPRRPS